MGKYLTILNFFEVRRVWWKDCRKWWGHLGYFRYLNFEILFFEVISLSHYLHQYFDSICISYLKFQTMSHNLTSLLFRTNPLLFSHLCLVQKYSYSISFWCWSHHGKFLIGQSSKIQSLVWVEEQELPIRYLYPYFWGPLETIL